MMSEKVEAHLQDAMALDILGILPNAILLAVDGRIVFANPAALELFGVADLPTLVEREAARAHVLGPDVERIEQRLAAIGRGEPQPATVSYRILRPDGTVRIVEWSTLPTTYDDRAALLYAVDDVTTLAEAREALELSERHQRNVFDALAEGVIVVDGLGICTDANPSAARMLELRSVADLVGAHTDLMPLLDAEGGPLRREDHPVWKALDHGEPVLGRVYTVVFPQVARRVRVSCMPILSAIGAHAGAVVTFDDVTVEIGLREELRDSEERFRRLIEQSPDVVVRIELNPWRIEYLSPSIANLTGHTPEEFYADPNLLIRTIHPDDFDLVVSTFSKATATRAECRFMHVDGSEATVEVRCNVVLSDGVPKVLEATLRDVTERVAEHEILSGLAHRDELTGLVNRRALMSALDLQLASRRPTSLIFLDLDGFKDVNDTYGHHAGDQVLRVCAQRLTSTLRAEEIVGRIGGDEFVAVCSTDQADIVARRILDTFTKPIRLDPDTEVVIGVSIGVTHVQSHGALQKSDELLRHADQAMYEAKRRGKGQIVTL